MPTLRGEELSTINYPLSTTSPVVGNAHPTKRGTINYQLSTINYKSCGGQCPPYEERNYQLSTINSPEKALKPLYIKIAPLVFGDVY